MAPIEIEGSEMPTKKKEVILANAKTENVAEF